MYAILLLKEDSGIELDFQKTHSKLLTGLCFLLQPSKPFANHNFVIPAAANMLFDLDICSHLQPLENFIFCNLLVSVPRRGSELHCPVCTVP